MAEIKKFKARGPAWLVSIRNEYPVSELEVDAELVFIKARNWNEAEQLRERANKIIDTRENR